MNETSSHFYICKCEWCIGDCNEVKTTYFICNANSYADCLNEFDYQFGNENIISVAMFELEEGPIEIHESVARALMNDEFFSEREMKNGTSDRNYL